MDNMEENWKDIKGFEGLYQVSNWGNVRSLDRYKKTKIQVNCYSLDGKFLKKFDSISSVKKEGHSAGIVSMCCRGLKNKHHNMLWKYAS